MRETRKIGLESRQDAVRFTSRVRTFSDLPFSFAQYYGHLFFSESA